MPFAANGKISTENFDGATRITQKQYDAALEGMLSGKIVVVDGGFAVIDPPELEPEPAPPPLTPEEARIAMQEQVNAERNRRINAGVTVSVTGYGDIPVQGREEDRINMLAARGVGTVSEDGGIPTGAIVQSGSNANGSFIRYADGTQICSAWVTSSSAGNVTWTFPMAFVSAPRILATCNAAENARIPAYANVLGGSCEIAVYSTSNARADNISTSVMALGRWC